jgi:hypothetical protein
MVERGLILDYVETNSSWVKSLDQAESVLAGLRDIGLESVLVSVSPFHAEYIPFDKTKNLIQAANRVLPGGAFPWVPSFVRDITSQPTDKKLDLTRLLEERGDKYACGLADRYGLIPAGRAGRYLAEHGSVFPVEDLFSMAPCLRRLGDTTHFHVDGQRRYVPGLCAGLVLPLEDLTKTIDTDRFPVIGTLYQSDGLRILVKGAEKSGFAPLDSYSSPCDLCTHVRKFLFENRPTPDLGPDGFYDDRSISFSN